jgi:hypothetical protein
MEDRRANWDRWIRINRRLAVSVPMLILGVLGLVSLFHFQAMLGGRASFLLWIAGGTLVGSGIFALFDRPILGAIIGFIIQAGLLAVLFSQPHIVG